MKKIHILGVAMVAMLAIGVVGAVSASAATVQWLKAGATITKTTGEPSLTTGEIVLGSTNGLKLGIKASVLCSGTFVGTVGPGAEDEVTGVLALTGGLVTLNFTEGGPLLNCVNVETCTSSSVAPVNLPWLSQLTSTTDDVLLPGAGGNPGWEVACVTSLGTVEETCTSTSQLSEVKNGASGEVLGLFIKSITATCTIGGANTGFVESSPTDATGLTTLANGEALSVSEA
jgi:hypothetical protein